MSSQLNFCNLTFYRGTKIGKGKPFLAAEIGPTRPILGELIFVRQAADVSHAGS